MVLKERSSVLSSVEHTVNSKELGPLSEAGWWGTLLVRSGGVCPNEVRGVTQGEWAVFPEGGE